MLRDKRCNFKDCGRGGSWGQGHFALPLALPPHVLGVLYFMLLVSLGIFVLNSCDFVIKGTHSISTSLRLSGC